MTCLRFVKKLGVFAGEIHRWAPQSRTYAGWILILMVRSLLLVLEPSLKQHDVWRFQLVSIRTVKLWPMVVLFGTMIRWHLQLVVEKWVENLHVSRDHEAHAGWWQQESGYLEEEHLMYPPILLPTSDNLLPTYVRTPWRPRDETCKDEHRSWPQNEWGRCGRPRPVERLRFSKLSKTKLYEY